MVIIIRHFLVDSENVNDNWLMLFDMADEDDEIVVFYTKKSPHMSYMSVIRLMENNSINVRFEECYEGTNAPVKAHVNMHPATLKYKITQSHIMIILQLLISLQTQQMYQQPHVLMSTS